MRIDNEFSFISSIKEMITSHSFLGIGDDCSAQIIKDNDVLLTTTDLLIENIHFKLDYISPFNLAQKAIEVNLSDIAAMGGHPRNIHISLAIPKKISEVFIKKFYEGLYGSLNEHKIELLGGDTTLSKNDFVINITAQGIVKKDKIKLRSSARTGDFICLLSPVGDSALGLQLLLNNKKTPSDIKTISMHNSPKAQIKQGQFLSNYSCVHAMIDLSDGIAKDLRHILQSSKKGAQIFLDKIPLSTHYQKSFKLFSDHKYELALCGGEDYSLLFTIAPADFKDISVQYKEIFNNKIYNIGTITDDLELSYYINNKKTNFAFNGYDHLGDQA